MMQERWQEIRKIHFEWADAYRILGGTVLVLFGVWLGSFLFAIDGPLYSEDGYKTNLYTEFISIGVTVFILDHLYRRRAEKYEIKQLRQQLRRAARSPQRAIAMDAMHEIIEHGWFYIDSPEPLLKDANLSSANLKGLYGDRVNLEGANLSFANLNGAILTEANLKNSSLILTKLNKADLTFAKLQNATFSGAELKNAKLEFANLEGAKLGNSNFCGANLFMCNLKNADLFHEIFTVQHNPFDGSFFGATSEWIKVEMDEATILPNGLTWTEETDLEMFTNPEHPDFFEPDWVTKNLEMPYYDFERGFLPFVPGTPEDPTDATYKNML
jgi:hypothetical protein